MDLSELAGLGIKACLSKPIRRSRLLNVLLQHGGNASVEDIHPADDDLKTPGASRQLPILVAEDNEVNQLVVAELLRSLGQPCELVANGRLALQACQTKKFALVIADMQMPELTGIEFVQQLREWEQTQPGRVPVPVVALSANAIATERARCLEAGMDEFLSKPVHRSELVGVLKRYLPAEQHPRTPAGERTIEMERRPAIVDSQRLMNRCSGNRELAARVLDKFARRLSPQVREIEILSLGRHMEGIRSQAHELTGSAATVSAVAVAAVAGDLERAAAENRVATVNELVTRLQDASEQFLAWHQRQENVLVTQ